MSGGRAGPRLLVILGPTGTGKSAVALRAALALDGEIVGCDALQVYRGFDSATAKPTAEDRRRVPHHLIDCADPRRDFSMGEYVRRAGAAIEGIAARGRTPIVVGGTGLYLRALLRGMIVTPPRDGVLRERLHRLATRHGAPRLHRWLSRLDPPTADRLTEGDTQRIVRALELALAGGLRWSARLAEEGTWAGPGSERPALKIGLDGDRDWLRERLGRRVAGFFAAGLVEEARGLLSAGVPPSANAFRAIGYREVLAALAAGADPAGRQEQVARATCRYARRQRTWFRREPEVCWLDAARGPEELAARVVELW